MKKKGRTVSLISFLFSIVLLVSQETSYSGPKNLVPQKNQCVICHTDVKKLIRLGWEIEKIRPKKGKSKEMSGEG